MSATTGSKSARNSARGPLFAIALALGLAAGHAEAAEWFVSTLGNDGTGTGSISAPFRTLNFVLDPANEIVQANDTVTLRGPAGNTIYNECEVRLRVPLTLRSQPGEWARIHCAISVEDSIAVQIDPDASGSRLSRIEISGGAIYAVFLQTDWEQVGNTAGRGASNIVIEDCILRDSGRDVVKITPKSNDVTIRRCEIYGSGQIYPPGTPLEEKNAEGIDNVNSARMTVEDNYIHDIATSGVYFKGGATDALVQRNVIERVGEGGILVGFDTSPEFFDLTENPGYFEAIRGIVRNNLIRDTGRAGIGLYASRDAIIANNTLLRTANIGQAAIYFGVTLQDFDPVAGRPASVNPRIVNNLVKTTGAACIGIRWANELGGLSGLSGSPGSNFQWFDDGSACSFFDGRPGSAIEDGGNLAAWRLQTGADTASIEAPVSLAADGRLLPTSAVIDRGTTLAEVTDDIDRESRSAPLDIGADELDLSEVFRDGFE